MGVQKTGTTPYHPQGDELVKSFNRSLIGIVRRYCADRPPRHLEDFVLDFSDSDDQS